MATVQGAGGVYLEVLQTAELPADLWMIQRLANSQGTTYKTPHATQGIEAERVGKSWYV